MGTFSMRRTVDGRPEELAVWRAVTSDAGTAERIAGAFGGQVRPCPERGALEVVTGVSEIRIVPGRAEPGGMRMAFRLVDGSVPGWFAFSSAPWSLGEVTTGVEGHGDRVGGWGSALLVVRDVAITTLTGLCVQHRMPELRLCAEP
ncbi:hypothetical protein [Streptomyces sp. NBC_00448]|uniref:hypothetical protein n=1 Tax=Streptomyces sp. NBC_00448 TaxID=2903652 RepID=UPI002E1CC6EE